MLVARDGFHIKHYQNSNCFWMFITHSYGIIWNNDEVLTHQKTWYWTGCLTNGVSTPWIRWDFFYGYIRNPPAASHLPGGSFQIQSGCKEPAWPTMDHDTWGEQRQLGQRHGQRSEQRGMLHLFWHTQISYQVGETHMNHL